MRIAVAALVVMVGCLTASADHPTLWTPPPIGYRFEPIPPLGNNLPLSYRARYNRPTYLGGKIAYHIAPSSQEAMSWHENVHRGAYRNHAGRIEPMYIYPKPWQVLPVGPRTPHDHDRDLDHDHDVYAGADAAPTADPHHYGNVPAAPVFVKP